MRVTSYELYEVQDGEWRLIARFGPNDEAMAKTQAEANWDQARAPTLLTEESEPDEGGDLSVTVAYRSPGAVGQARPPDLDGGFTGRVAMAGLNSALIGAVAGGLAAAGSGGEMGLALLAFLVVTAGALLVLFRVMVPMEIMLWRNKSTESKQLTIDLLARESGHDPEAEAAASEAEAQARYADLGQRSRRNAAVAPHKSSAPPSETMSVAASATALLQQLIDKQTGVVSAFAADVMGKLAAQGVVLQSFDRFGVNLYLAGAAQEIARREALTQPTLHSILTNVLVEHGTAADSAKTFCERLETAAARPRFRAMLNAGEAAMKAVLDQQPIPDAAAIAAMLKGWSNPDDRNVAPQRYGVLLTDIVGSTEMTRKLGNTAAQRALRAHNSIVRAALKQFRGEEIKHTGDGIMAVFTKAVDAAEAAIAIQQDVFAFGRDNPDLPFKVRIGVEFGEGAKEDGEYFGPAFSAIEDICAVGGGGDIVVTAAAQDLAKGANLRYAPVAAQDAGNMKLFRLAWEPKRVFNAAPLEYRQIGGAPGKDTAAKPKLKDGEEPDF
ncbi:MAG: adenylate/guanylate cyclase domain-containing protein [Rhodospirillaceae bacterium]|nr:adenylate/guanylate cyclase domain-containing protein [Rhodospirillaceae bacterium]